MNRRNDMINRGRETGRPLLEGFRKAHPLAFSLGSLLLCLGAYSQFPDSPSSMPLVATLASAMLASVAYIAAGLQGATPADRRVTASHRRLVSLLVLLAAVATSVLQASHQAGAPAMPGEGADGSAVACRLALCLAYCLLTGIFEEVAFRGLFYSSLIAGPLNLPASRFRANCAQAALFGVMHAGFSSAFPGFVGVFEFGVMLLRLLSALLFAFLMTRFLHAFGTIAAPIAVHSLYDFILFAPLIFMGDAPNGALAITALSPTALALQTAFLAAAVLAAYAASRIAGR